MAKFAITSAAVVIAAASIVSGCANRNIGFILGSPSGLSYSQDLFGDRIAAGLGWTFINGDGPELHVDWIRHTSERLPGTAAAYWGVGYRYRDRDAEGTDDDDFESGIRVPLGIAYYPTWDGMEIFAEAAPGVDFVDPRFTFDLGIGMRVAF